MTQRITIFVLLLFLPATFSFLIGRRSVDSEEQVLNEVDDGASARQRLPSGRRFIDPGEMFNEEHDDVSFPQRGSPPRGRRAVDREEMFKRVDDGVSYPDKPPSGRRSIDPEQNSKHILKNRIFRP